MPDRTAPTSVRAATLVATLLVTGCSGPGGPGGGAAPVAPRPITARNDLEPFVQAIPGTTVTFEMVPVPAVGLWFSKYEIRWDEFDVWFQKLDLPDPLVPEGADAVARPSRAYGDPTRGYGREGFPAISMSAHAAATFAQWMAKKTGRKYRLPTSDEWQVACAADEPRIWSADNADDHSHAVADTTANRFGLHGMLGNVAEFVQDAGGMQAAGGSFRDAAAAITPALRVYESPAWRKNDPNEPKSRFWYTDCGWVGIRLVCEP